MSRDQGRRGAGLGSFARRASGVLVPKKKEPDPLLQELELFQQRQEFERQLSLITQSKRHRGSSRQMHRAKMVKKRHMANKRAKKARKVNRV